MNFIASALVQILRVRAGFWFRLGRLWPAASERIKFTRKRLAFTKPATATFPGWAKILSMLSFNFCVNAAPNMASTSSNSTALARNTGTGGVRHQHIDAGLPASTLNCARSLDIYINCDHR